MNAVISFGFIYGQNTRLHLDSNNNIEHFHPRKVNYTHFHNKKKSVRFIYIEKTCSIETYFLLSMMVSLNQTISGLGFMQKINGIRFFSIQQRLH
jgi:hypothetical protein